MKFLYKVKADIFLKNKDWLFLNTEKIIFKINSKTLHADEKVQGFYDDGSGFSSLTWNITLKQE